ncbi:MAG: alkylhydroperoxidase-related (seleno)protein, partial [Burkholderiaceae bacterium]
MPTVSYDDAPFDVREQFADSHNRYWARLRMPGAWLTSAEKIAIAKEARAAAQCPLCQQNKKALAPRSVSGSHSAVTDLRPEIIEIVHNMINDASRQTQAWYKGLLSESFTDGAYVEVVGTVVAMISIDSFAEGLGLAHRELPEPGTGKPTGYRPATAVVTDDAWV